MGKIILLLEILKIWKNQKLVYSRYYQELKNIKIVLMLMIKYKKPIKGLNS